MPIMKEEEEEENVTPRHLLFCSTLIFFFNDTLCPLRIFFHNGTQLPLRPQPQRYNRPTHTHAHTHKNTCEKLLAKLAGLETSSTLIKTLSSSSQNRILLHSSLFSFLSFAAAAGWLRRGGGGIVDLQLPGLC